MFRGGFIKITAGPKKATKQTKRAVKEAVQANGPQVGKEFLATLQKEFAQKYQNAIVLICVAGMSYSSAVESKGFDVITGSSQAAVISLKESIERIRKKILKAA